MNRSAIQLGLLYASAFLGAGIGLAPGIDDPLRRAAWFGSGIAMGIIIGRYFWRQS